MSYWFHNSFTSPYWKWFIEAGYPQLDLRFCDHIWRKGKERHQVFTGEWAIYEMFSPPYLPAELKWRDVLTGLKHVEINRTNIKRLCESIDLKRREVWDREIAKSEAVEAEHERVQEKRMDTINRITQAYTRNEGLMQRIAKNGLWEMDPHAIIKHIPRSRF